jgi:hypothetical protein
LRNAPPVVKLALLATWAVLHVNAVPLPVAVEDVQTPQPLGNAVPKESKFWV